MSTPGTVVQRDPPAAVLRRWWVAVLALMCRDVISTVCVGVVALVSLIAIFAPLIAPHDPNQISLEAPNLGFSTDHVLGTDSNGRDLFSRMVYGARPSLLGPLGVIILATVAATTLALVAAWFRGWPDHVIAGALDVIFGFPGLLLAIGAVALFGTGLIAPVIALGIANTPYIARVLRSALIRERQLPYVQALVVQGMSGWRIALRHLLPNVRGILLAQATLAFAYATIDLAAISYLGLGVQPPTADWGRMVADGQPAILEGHVKEALYPGIALIVVILAVTTLGRRMARDSVEVM